MGVTLADWTFCLAASQVTAQSAAYLRRHRASRLVRLVSVKGWKVQQLGLLGLSSFHCGSEPWAWLSESWLPNKRKVGKQICKSRGFIPIRQKQSQKVTTVLWKWVIFFEGRNSEYQIHEFRDSTVLLGGEKSGVCFSLRQPQFVRRTISRDAPCLLHTQQE
jgi:hypothetical protein